MDAQQREKRKRIMARSLALGHCVCDPRKPCPCPVFKEYNVCECAGERMPLKVSASEVKLTEYVRSAGCASKIGKKDLKEILGGLPEIADPRVLVGSSAGDDAGVLVLSETADDAIILTIDVFAPSVDNAYEFGQVAAANSVSDIYAMGGKPVSALSVIGFPIYHLPNEVMKEILRGGIDKMKEAGIPVVGGHSINDEEIKCGFAVVGTCPKSGFVRNSGAQAGDAIILTKPLGGGIVAFGKQIGRASTEEAAEITRAMTTLNKDASELMVKAGAHAATDVTGYSLLGHLVEIVVNSKVDVEIDFDKIPLFSAVQKLARMEALPGAVERNREAVNPELLDFTSLADAQRNVMFCPETSGGLLVFLPADAAGDYVEELNSLGHPAAIIGKVTGQGGKIKVVTAGPEAYSPLKPEPIEQPQSESKAAAVHEEEVPCCCEDPDQVADTDMPHATEAFGAYMGAVMKPDKIDAKHKKLMALALSVATKCGPCVTINIKAAREAGATEEQIAEAAALGIAFGGASTGMFYNELRH